MDTYFAIPVLVAFGYLTGSVPFGLVLCRLAGYGDIRRIGSGNIGATNVLRTGNKPLAALTLFLDGGKGAFAALAVHVFYDIDMALVTGLGAVIGHIFPVWLKFKGGKGVATTLGTLVAAAPLSGLIACAVWLGAAVMFRISSLAALIAMAVAPVVTFFIYGSFPAAVTVIISAIVWVRHKDNILRLLRGEEPKIGKKNEGGQAAKSGG